MRSWILTVAVLSIFMCADSAMADNCANSAISAKCDKLTKDSWKLAIQAYSFKKFTLFEAIEKAQQAGLNCIEAYPGQVINRELLSDNGKPVKFLYTISPETINLIKAKLYDHNVRLINFGVTGLADDEAGLRQAFEFAKEMGIETILSEPKPEQIPLIDKFCQEYKINLGIHNHPKPSRYWNPETVLEAVKGASKYVGASADTGHWLRSGLDAVESLQKLEGRLISFHLKDLNEAGVKKAHDVPWGTGVTGIKNVLNEAKRQNFKGVFSIEYEYKWDDSVGDITKCVEYFNKTKNELLAK